MTRPIFEVTPTHVISFGIKLSEADAEGWLKLWTDTFSLEMKDIVTPELNRMFHRATLRDCPGRAFDRFRKKVDEAIYTAEVEYAEKVSLCHSGDFKTEHDRSRMVAYLMGGGSRKREAICYQKITMKPPDSGEIKQPTKEERPVLVIAERGMVRARVLEVDEQLRKKILVFGSPDRKPEWARSKAQPKNTSPTVH
jgi:hypothetical protein